MAIGSVLLAAGRGIRLRPLTDGVPKPCLPMLDVPLLLWPLTALAEARPPVLVNASHLPDEVAACAATGTVARDAYEIAVERPEPLGTAGTLAAHRDRVEGPLLTWNADAFTDLDPQTLLDAHTRSGAPATVAVTRVEHHADLVAEGGRATALLDRRRSNVPGWRFIGAAVFERDALDQIPHGVPLGLTEALLRPLADDGALTVLPHDGVAIDVGTLARYLEASLMLLDGRGPASPIPLPGDVLDFDGGRAYVGPGAAAPIETLRPGGIVLAGATVKPGAVVSSAIVWPGETVPSGTHLHRSIWLRGRSFPVDVAGGPAN